jgi:flagellar biosynthesis/type III secretory pathway protein FliH
MLNCNCEVCKDAREQHDATIRKEERERILDEMTEYAAELEIAYRNGFNDGQAEGLGQAAPRDPPGSRS